MKRFLGFRRSASALLLGMVLTANLQSHGAAVQFPWVCSFDGNNVPDVLWHYKGNSVQAPLNAVWLMNGLTISSGIPLATSGDPNWSLAGVGRFHQVSQSCLQDPNCPDRNRDILWRHTSSALAAVWFMNGTAFQGAALLNQDPGASWRIGATADFNEDGYTDILWDDNATGTKVVWLMQGQAQGPPARIQTITLDQSGLTGWKVMLAGDFGAPGSAVPDAHPDILLYNLNSMGMGTMQIWYLRWNATAQTIDILNPKTTITQIVADGDWKPLQAGDLNADGKTDIIFRHATMGQNAVWFMNGASYVGAAAPAGADLFDTDWKMVGQGNQESTLRLDVVSASLRAQVTATVEGARIRLNLSFPPLNAGQKFRVWRKLTTAASWGAPVQDNLLSTTWLDTGVQTGVRYDYRVARVNPSGLELEFSTVSASVASTAVMTPIVSRGRAIVMVDSTLAVALTPTLDQLKRDLVADGWEVPNLDFANPSKYVVNRHVDYPDPPQNPGASFYFDNNYANVINARDKIKVWLQPGIPNAVLLIGHVPVPYSGYQRADGHSCCAAPPDHGGAWACDMVYATPNTSWPDTGANSVQRCFDAAIPPAYPYLSDYGNCYWEENSNHAGGDGKFDLDAAPGALGVPIAEAAVGRIDFARMTRFPQTEIQLIQRYFDKVHRFRCNMAPYSAVPFQDKGVAMTFPGGAPAVRADLTGYAIQKTRNLYGLNSLVVGDPFRQNRSKAFAWGFPFGFGCVECVYSTSGAGLYSTTALASTSPEARIGFFVMLGSFFGDFDKSQNFMRASIATPDYGFAAMWTTSWNVDSMAIGEHLGTALVRTVDTFDRRRYLAIMGDPTLRLFRVPPPVNVSLTVSSGVVLSWSAVANTSYCIYGASSAYGPFTFLTATSGGSYSQNPSLYSHYMVRAVKLINTQSSGSYWEISQGVVKP